jgi:hypothetical protein
VPSAPSVPRRRQADLHALAIQQRLDAIERRVDDLLLAARVVAIVVSGNALLHVLDSLA